MPAWACGFTGTTPGQLGLYGFRNRKDTTYDGLSIAHSGSIKVPAVWDALGAQGKRSVLIGVPPSFPPPAEFPGWRVGCFLTPPSAERWAYPQELEVEIEEELGGKGQYIFDIPNFRQAGYDTTLDQVFKMTERRFQVGRRMIQNKPWDFFMLCDIAPDRLHHVFWQFYDKRHPLYEPGNKYEGIFQDYYRFLDRQLADFLELVPEDAVTIVMSRPRRASDDGRPVLQRLADPGGVPDARGAGHEARCRSRTQRSTGRRTRRLGRRWVLRPAVPQREGPRAAGAGRAGRTTRRRATS